MDERAFLKTPEKFSGPKKGPVKLPKIDLRVSQSTRTFRAQKKSSHVPPIMYGCLRAPEKLFFWGWVVEILSKKPLLPNREKRIHEERTVLNGMRRNEVFCPEN